MGETYHNRKVAIIHIGTMKVGTSSIQEFFRANREKICDRDGAYWLADYIRDPATLIGHMKKARAGGKSIILCDEGLWHHAFTGRVDLRGLKDVLPGYEFRVIMYVRRPDEFLESWYLQGIKSGSGTPLFGDFVKTDFVRRGLDFRGRLPKVEAIFGPITVRAYERSQLKNGDSVSDFLQFAGVDEDGLIRPSLANVTPDPNALMMARVMREKADRADHAMIHKIAEGIGCADRVSILYPQEVREIEHRYRGQIEWLHETYGTAGRNSFFDKWIIPPTEHSQGSLRPVYDRLMSRQDDRGIMKSISRLFAFRS